MTSPVTPSYPICNDFHELKFCIISGDFHANLNFSGSMVFKRINMLIADAKVKDKIQINDLDPGICIIQGRQSKKPDLEHNPQHNSKIKSPCLKCAKYAARSLSSDRCHGQIHYVTWFQPHGVLMELCSTNTNSLLVPEMYQRSRLFCQVIVITIVFVSAKPRVAEWWNLKCSKHKQYLCFREKAENKIN
jgi:hypothetical protein